MSAPWRDLHDAPRDKPVWLFLPSSKFDTDEHGRPTNVSHETLVGRWDAEQSAWLVGQRHVYPSMWCDTPAGGDTPESPVMA